MTAFLHICKQPGEDILLHTILVNADTTLLEETLMALLISSEIKEFPKVASRYHRSANGHLTFNFVISSFKLK